LLKTIDSPSESDYHFNSQLASWQASLPIQHLLFPRS